jgi:hypothetical protein
MLAAAAESPICLRAEAGLMPVGMERGLIYLVCIFLSPLALLLIGKPIQFVVNLVLWLLAVIFSLTIIGFIPFGVGFWGVAVLHAILAVNNHRAEKRNRALIDAMKGGRA